jgi:hypothetical protein
MSDRRIRTLLVDLNNYARFPTLAIGYLVAALRREGIDVEVLSPLAYGLPATEREHQETLRDQLVRRAYFATHPALISSHDALRNARARRSASRTRAWCRRRRARSRSASRTSCSSPPTSTTIRR